MLVGNPETNSVWRALEPRLPLQLATERVRLYGSEWQGRALGVQAVVPHPDNPSRAIILIGSADLTACRFGTMDLSIDGWFTMAIWDGSTDVPTVMAQ